VAPGTVFALFAAIYHWAPSVLGRTLSTRLGHWHFWPTFVLMNSIFLPMFLLGLAGVNRRLYDAGAQYALARGLAHLQQHITWSAFALGVAQLPFLLALVTARRVEATDDHVAPPATAESDELTPAWPRAGQVAPWLIVAWLVMLFGSLLSGWVLLRTGQTVWPQTADAIWLGGGAVLMIGAALLLQPSRTWLVWAGLLTLGATQLATRALSTAWAAGHVPSAHNAHALWFTITGVLTVLAAVACAALLHTARTEPSYDRVQALRPPFATLSLLWLVISFVFLAG